MTQCCISRSAPVGQLFGFGTKLLNSKVVDCYISCHLSLSHCVGPLSSEPLRIQLIRRDIGLRDLSLFLLSKFAFNSGRRMDSYVSLALRLISRSIRFLWRSGGSIPDNIGSTSVGVDLRHPLMVCIASFKALSTLLV